MKVYCKSCHANYHSPYENSECPSCGNTDQEDFILHEDEPIHAENRLIAKWVELGRDNYWIARAWDPQFDERSFYECQTLGELILKLAEGNWSTGSAFYYKNMAFINQVNGGDEWLVIRDDIAFESWSCGHVIESKGSNYFASRFYQMFHATDSQLRNLNYSEVEVPETFDFDGIDFIRVGRGY